MGSKLSQYTDEELKEMIKGCTSLPEFASMLGYKSKGSIPTVENYLREHNIDFYKLKSEPEERSKRQWTLDSTIRGITNEADILAYVVSKGYYVSCPFGYKAKYDQIWDIDDTLLKIQIKTAKENRNGFSLETTAIKKKHNKTIRTTYSTKDVDFFATYYNGNVYMIPASECNISKIINIVNPNAKNYGDKYLFDNVVSSIKSSTFFQEYKPAEEHTYDYTEVFADFNPDDYFTAKDLKRILKLSSIDKAYRLMKKDDFPSEKIGNLIRVKKDNFLSYFNIENCNQSGITNVGNVENTTKAKVCKIFIPGSSPGAASK